MQHCLGLLDSYSFDEPFHLYLAQAFKTQRGWGSRDRKRYRRWCYTYFKFSHIDTQSWPHQLSEEALIIALLASPSTLEDERNAMLGWGYSQKTSTTEFKPFDSNFSKGVDPIEYYHWFQQEPPVFVRRLKPWKSDFPAPLNSVDDFYLKFAPGTSLQQAQELGFCFIQDLGSQLSVQHECFNSRIPLRVWDACCGAGGKSLQLSSQYKTVQLICSDTRKSILDNLRSRFQSAQLPVPETFDFNPIKDPHSKWKGPESFDRIVLDVPCSGSGTWRRNPEEWHQFQSSKLEALRPVQAELLISCSTRLKAGGYLVYITCSVFQEENEKQVADFLNSHPEFQLEEQGILGGPSQDADYLFRALIKKIN